MASAVDERGAEVAEAPTKMSRKQIHYRDPL
jgi:hypothetical protein